MVNRLYCLFPVLSACTHLVLVTCPCHLKCLVETSQLDKLHYCPISNIYYISERFVCALWSGHVTSGWLCKGAEARHGQAAHIQHSQAPGRVFLKSQKYANMFYDFVPLKIDYNGIKNIHCYYFKGWAKNNKISSQGKMFITSSSWEVTKRLETLRQREGEPNLPVRGNELRPWQSCNGRKPNERVLSFGTRCKVPFRP